MGNTVGIISLIMGIISITTEESNGLGIAGLVLGIIGFVIWLIVFLFIATLFGLLFALIP